MGALLGTFVGVVLALLSLRWSRAYLVTIQSGITISPWLSFGLIMVGGTTSALIWASFSVTSALLGIVTCLLIVQTPLDLLVRRLARWPTLLALLAVSVIRILEAASDARLREVITQFAATAALLAILTVFYRLSPQSLGWGDVLLVAPLSIAVTSVRSSLIIIWMLTASSSAALHGLVLWRRSGSRHAPFGPHLLGAAWLVLVLSV
ncbi:MAG: hypothetical protein EBZ61_06350 [Micrococcales bacterium]|nr:hypothetical protein [Micrococcales bacterium]